MRSKTVSVALVVSISSLLLLGTGCADKKKASTTTFKAALEDHFKAHPVCLAATALKFPDEVTYDPSGRTWSMSAKMDDALASAKLLTATEGTKSSQTFTGKTVSQRVVTYAIADPTQWSDRCAQVTGTAPVVGDVEIESVDNFTEPADLYGQHVSQVEFTYKFQNLKPWLESPALVQTDPSIPHRFSTDDRKGKGILILKNSGWELDSSHGF